MPRLAAAWRGLAAAAAALLTVALVPSSAGAGPVAAPSSHRAGADDPKAPKEFVALRDVDPTIIQEIRYATPHDFMGVPVTGYREPLCILTRDAARALHRAQVAFLRRGYSLKVYDCYRPQRAVDHFVAWAKDLSDQRMKAEFYPRVDKSVLFRDGYIAEKSGHSRGSTVDLTLVRLPAVPTRPYVPGEPLTSCFGPRASRFPDNSLDMGTGFDCFDTLAHTLDPRIKGKQRAHRMLLKEGLERAGFVNYADEWWHYTFSPETFPDTSFDFPVARSSLVRR
ncbi:MULTISPECIES: M15 family metallopeptidase [Streptomyces]|uniref:M15 family metallopeptidase n=1 Tax=Streptomyces TaxID=1883 RepID=UPI00196652E1|nr:MULTISPECIES: M15 family metallopeptidase [Streptomyces]QRX90974.1 M15 family metallopeptidase [Streptomyces noursei]UJB40826.1 M15 family metallopeptidase [Streptomyces sp. A1-5]